MKHAVLFGLVLLATGCGLMPQETGRQAQAYEVLAVDPPKRMHVDLRNTATGEVFRGVSVAKRCSNWKRLEIGSVHTLTEVSFTYEDGRVERRVEGAGALCPG